MRSDRGKHDMIYTKAGEILKKNGPCIKTEADELVCIKVSQALFKAVVKHSLTTAFFSSPGLFYFGSSCAHQVMAISKGFIRNLNFAYRRKEVTPNEI